MLRSEINELEKSINALIEQTGIAHKSLSPKEIAESVSHVKTLGNDLKKKWTQELLSNAKEQVIKRYVQYHQAGIIQLSDKVSRQIPALNSPDDVRKLQRESFDEIKSVLEKVLDFLRHNFYQYYDLDHHATIYYCDLLPQKIAEFEPGLTDVTYEVSDTLIHCVLSSVKEKADEAIISGISYRQADQCLNLVRMVYHLLRFGANTQTNKLVKALYQQNMNTLYFFNWYQQNTLDLLEKITVKEKREAAVREQISLFTGIFVLPEKALQPELPSTRDFINSWLEQLLKPENTDTNYKFPTFQLPLNLSVPQFALFVRVFYKTGCFSIENVALITRFFTEHFTTKKQPHISQKSFSRAFYNLDQSAAAVVRDFLQKMLNYLNKTYFP